MTADEIAQRRPDESLQRLKEARDHALVLQPHDAKAVLEHVRRLEDFIHALP